MRFERHGGPPDLQTAFTALISSHLRGRILDDNKDFEAAQGQFPDFSCFRGIVLVEMKHLETDQQDRINELIDEKLDPIEKPFFYGSRESHFIVDAASNSEAINAAISSKLARTIETLLKKANAQFESYRSRNPRKNSVGICVILNSSLREWSPDVIAHAIHSKMKVSELSESRFQSIDAVLYISEKHMRRLPDGRPAHGIIIYEAQGALTAPWKMQFVNRIADAWSLMRTGSPIAFESEDRNFVPVEDIPKSMPLDETWRLEYQRDPYLQMLPVEKLRAMFQRTIAVNSLAFLKGNWPKPSHQETSKGMRMFTHIIEETNRRGIDLRLLHLNLLTPAESAQVYIGLPDELVAILSKSHSNDQS
jgi:hypothetical protein